MKRFCTLIVALTIVFSFAISPLSNPLSSGVMTVDAESIDTIQALVPGLTGTVLSEFDEDMNTIGVENEDGTNTVYLFDQDIKYVDSNGEIQYYDIEEITATSTSASGTIELGSGYIYDATVYSNEPTTTHGTGNLAIGYDGTLGTARTYIKFDISNIRGTVNTHNIVSAHYHVRDITNTSVGTNAVAEVYFASALWNETSITWNNKPDYYPEKICSTNIFHGIIANMLYVEYDIYITSAVSAWLQGVSNFGLMIKAYDDTSWRQLASSENTEYPPYLAVTYYDDTTTDTGKAVGITGSSKYVIINKNSEKYMTAHSLIAGDYVSQAAGANLSLQCWKPVYLGNGYYALKVNDSNVCLEVPNGTLTAGIGLTMANYTGATRQKWRIIRNWDGSYRILSALSNSYCVSMADITSTNGVRVVLKTRTTNFSKEDDWTFLPAQKGTASLFCFTSSATGNINTTASMESVSSYLGELEFTPTLYTNSNASTGFTELQNSSVYIFAGHGQEGAFHFYTSPSDVSSIASFNLSIPTYNINSLSATAFDNLVFCDISSCLTGSDKDGKNTIGLMYQMGAHNLISHIRPTMVGPDSFWISRFLMNLYVGRSIGEAKDYTDYLLYEAFDKYYGNLNERHDLGDQSIYLNYATYPASSTSSASSGRMQSTPAISSFTIEKTFSDNSVSPVKSIATLSNSEPAYVCTLDEDIFGNEYDIYQDAEGSVYHFYKDTDTLTAYEPNVSALTLGATEVSAESALALAADFLANMGYETTSFVRTHSNDFSKEFRIEYRYLLNGKPTSEKMVFRMQADENGEVYITSFIAKDYGAFSQKDVLELSAVSTISTEVNMLSPENVLNAYWAIDSEGIVCWRSLVVTQNEKGNEIRVVDTY